MIENLMTMINAHDYGYLSLIVITLVIGMFASYYHEVTGPIIWSSITAFILYYNYMILNPIMTTWTQLQIGSLYFMLGMAFTLSWVLVLLMAFKNMIFDGKVIT